MDDKKLGRVAGPTYFLALLFLGLSALDFVMNVWPLRPGDVSWRYGAIGLAGGFLLTPLLGLVILLAASRYFGHQGVRRLTLILSAALAALLLLASLSFVLDALQMRRAVEAAQKWMFDGGVAKALVKLTTGAVSAAWVAGAAFDRGGRVSGDRTTRRDGAPLVVGSRTETP